MYLFCKICLEVEWRCLWDVFFYVWGIYCEYFLERVNQFIYLLEMYEVVNFFFYWCIKQIFLYYFILVSFDKLKLKLFKFVLLLVRLNVFLQVIWFLNFMYLLGIILRLSICKCFLVNVIDIFCINVRDYYFFLDCFIFLFMIFF